MHLLITVLLVFAVWTALAFPLAIFVGHFLRAGSQRSGHATGSEPGRSFRNVA